jgi:hypothetical protein
MGQRGLSGSSDPSFALSPRPCVLTMPLIAAWERQTLTYDPGGT